MHWQLDWRTPLHSRKMGQFWFSISASGSEAKTTGGSAKLADDLSTVLAATPKRLHVQDHSRLKKLMGENSLEFENIFDPGIATWLAEDLGAQALVLGKLERNAGNVKLSVTSYSARDERGDYRFRNHPSLTDE